MLKTLIEKELRETIGSTKFALTFGACAVLLLLTFYVGGRNYQVSQTQYEMAVKANYRQMADLTDWRQVNNHRVFLPPQPLGTLVSGVSNDVGRATAVTGRGEITATDSRYGSDPLFAMFRFLDLEFMFTIVISLFAILFGYDAISGEKERGTLRLVLSNAVPRDRYILGKLIGAFLALAVPLLIPVLLGCVLLQVMGIPINAEGWLRLALIFGAGFLYLGAFLTLSVMVSALTRRSTHAFLFLLMAWILGVLILPRVAVLLAGRAVDVPTVDALMAEKSVHARQLWEEDMDRMTTFELPPDVTEPQEMMGAFQSFMNDMADAREEKMNTFAERLNEQRRNRQKVQERLAFGLSRLSPAAAFTLAASHLAGTSIRIKDHFEAEALAYQEAYGQFMLEKTGANMGGGLRVMMHSNRDEEVQPIDPYEMPAFAYSAPVLREVLPSAFIDLGLLALFNALFFIGAFVAFLRYDVR